MIRRLLRCFFPLPEQSKERADCSGPARTLSAYSREDMEQMATHMRAADETLQLYDYYRARCLARASDVGPECSDDRVCLFALAEGWVEIHDPPTKWGSYTPPRLVFHTKFRHVVDQDNAASGIASFCNKHAQASGLAPLDVLDAIGKMP